MIRIAALASALLLSVPVLAQDSKLATATFAGGCFWCVEEAFDHSTMTQRAASSASSMTSSNCLPGGMVRSHQTDQPCSVSACATARARSRSALA